MEVEGSRHGGV
jgi:hypothetical protein